GAQRERTGAGNGSAAPRYGVRGSAAGNAQRGAAPLANSSVARYGQGGGHSDAYWDGNRVGKAAILRNAARLEGARARRRPVYGNGVSGSATHDGATRYNPADVRRGAAAGRIRLLRRNTAYRLVAGNGIGAGGLGYGDVQNIGYRFAGAAVVIYRDGKVVGVGAGIGTGRVEN
nr:hypothetical protein [Tanacetum cinerariifolium]